MKGGLAAAVTAIETVMNSGVKLKGDVFMTAVAGESEKAPVEGGIRSYRGARYQGGGFGAGYLISHIPLPDYAVVCEPGGPYVVSRAVHTFPIWTRMQQTRTAKACVGQDIQGYVN